MNGNMRNRKRDMGYLTRGCFYLKEELKRNITPWRDKGQQKRGRERKMEEGLQQQ